jgi:adhesin transport system membrane fusion protein
MRSTRGKSGKPSGTASGTSGLSELSSASELARVSGTVGTGDCSDWVREAEQQILAQEPLRARVLLYLCALAVALLLLWAGFARVDEVTRGESKVIPSQQLQVLQSFDGGIVSEILVKEGQIVQAGEMLVRIDSTRFESSLRESGSMLLSLAAKAARLKALASGQPFIPPPEVVRDDPKTAEAERQLYENANSELNAQVAIARQQLTQRQQELAEAQARHVQAGQALASSERELQLNQPLIKSGAISEIELIRLGRDVGRFRGERDIAAAQINRFQATITEANRKIQEVELNFRNQARREAAETQAKLNSLTQGNTGLSDKVKHSALRSPVRGTIKRLMVSTVGGVVQAGRDVVEIVPLEGALLLEAKMQAKDIAFLHPGQKALVKFTAYDFAIYGGLEATLEHIAADSVTDDHGNTFYTVRVRTQQAQLGPNLPIIPGMVAEVDILTGKKSVLAYLLKPVLRARQGALRER